MTNMSDRVCYCSKPMGLYKTLYRVWVRGYNQGTSIESLRRSAQNTWYYYRGKYTSSYEVLPRVLWWYEVRDNLVMEEGLRESFPSLDDTYTRTTIADVDYELPEFYKEIQYEPKTKKINGRTFLQHLKHYST